MVKINFLNLWGDFIGGLIVGIVVLLLVFVFGVVLGLGLMVGLYGVIVVGFFVVFFGGILV